VLTWYSDPGRGEILSLNVESDLVPRAGSVAVKGRDPLSKKTLESKASSGTVDRATLGDVLEVVDARTGETSLQDRNATSSTHPTAASNATRADRESGARFRRAERETIKLSMQAVGDPTLRAKAVLEIRGISSLLSGKYYVNEAKHAISGSGYVVDLRLTRDATGPRRQANVDKQGQPQGGNRNRAAAASGGALAEIEVVDRQTGETRVEYHRATGQIGAGDPEASTKSSR
jgi:hypothetical protein